MTYRLLASTSRDVPCLTARHLPALEAVSGAILAILDTAQRPSAV